MDTATDVDLAPFTTLRLGGPARRMVDATSDDALVEAVASADEPVLVLAGGSNVVIADAGFDGLVVRVATRGVARERLGDGRVRVTAAAGERWDDLVAACVADGLSGIESLSGIPGSTGATPIQNVGAYGQDVAQTIAGVRVHDRATGETLDLAPADCGFAYRSSRFKYRDRWVVLSVAFDLRESGLGGPVAYAELARALGVEPGERVPLAEQREAVLALRRGKGMVVSPDDPDSVSAGSFFTNPILSPEAFGAIPGDPPAWPEPDGRVKTSAAWLIGRAGFQRGYPPLPARAGISTKHTLALVNRGGATTAELVALAREIAGAVRDTLGVALHPEPVFVGHTW
ncbi:MAG: UDP-N-acetylmuramate dehydrogenase [Solirubrobacteraceae bacterium]|nr:UDP-N-acetylmuramate dehydrogenase [Solirubrobacteraceae bacterium]